MLVLDSEFTQSGAIPFNAPAQAKQAQPVARRTRPTLQCKKLQSTQRLRHEPGKCLFEARVQDALQATDQCAQGCEISGHGLTRLVVQGESYMQARPVHWATQCVLSSPCP